MITTTLNKIRSYSPCTSGWDKLLKSLNKILADDIPLKFSTILESNGIDDTLWCLRSICPEHAYEVRLFAADCAEAVLHIFEKKYPDDKRPHLSIEAARKFANREISGYDMHTAGNSAEAAAKAATSSAATEAALAARHTTINTAWSAAQIAVKYALGAAGADAWTYMTAALGDALNISGDTNDATWHVKAATYDEAFSSTQSAQIKMLTERFS
jgi:hypothetical protein